MNYYFMAMGIFLSIVINGSKTTSCLEFLLPHNFCSKVARNVLWWEHGRGTSGKSSLLTRLQSRVLSDFYKTNAHFNSVLLNDVGSC